MPTITVVSNQQKYTFFDGLIQPVLIEKLESKDGGMYR